MVIVISHNGVTKVTECVEPSLLLILLIKLVGFLYKFLNSMKGCSYEAVSRKIGDITQPST